MKKGFKLIAAIALACCLTGCNKSNDTACDFSSLNYFNLSENTPIAIASEWGKNETNKQLFTENANFAVSQLTTANGGSTVNLEKIWRQIDFPAPNTYEDNEYFNKASIINNTITVYAPDSSNYAESWDPSTAYSVNVTLPTKSWDSMTSAEQTQAKELAVGLYWNANNLLANAPYYGYSTIGGYSFESMANFVYMENGLVLYNNGEYIKREYRHPTHEDSGVGAKILKSFMDGNIGVRYYRNLDMDYTLYGKAKNNTVDKETGASNINWTKDYSEMNLDSSNSMEAYCTIDYPDVLTHNTADKLKFTLFEEKIESGFGGINDTIESVEFTSHNGYISMDIMLDASSDRATECIKNFRLKDDIKKYQTNYIKVSIDLYNNGFYRAFTYNLGWQGNQMADIKAVDTRSYLFFYSEEDCEIDDYIDDWSAAKTLSDTYRK